MIKNRYDFTLLMIKRKFKYASKISTSGINLILIVLILSFTFTVTNIEQINANEYYNNSNFYYDPTDQQIVSNTQPTHAINGDSYLLSDIITLIQQIDEDQYNEVYHAVLQVSNFQIPTKQSESIIGKCVNEQGYNVNPSIRVITSVKNDLLKIIGIGIHYDSNFDDTAIISISPVNDYDGTKDIHIVEVRNDGKFIELFDVSKIFYNDYVNAGTHYNGNIDSLGNYLIEVQYDDQCGFTNLEHDHKPNQPPTVQGTTEIEVIGGVQSPTVEFTPDFQRYNYFANGNISSELYENGNIKILYYENGNKYATYWDNGNFRETYHENGYLSSTYYENGDRKELYDKNGNIIKTYSISEPISTYDPIDYSNACIDEHHNFQESTINISASKTLVKENTIGSPISGNGIVKSGWADSAIFTILGPDNVSTSYEIPVKSDGTFWKFFETQELFFDDSPYGNYLINVSYNDQCGFITIDYMRGHPPSTTPTLEEVQESTNTYEPVQEVSEEVQESTNTYEPVQEVSEEVQESTNTYEPVQEVSESVEVAPYKLSLGSGHLVDAHRSHAEVIEINFSISCMDGKSPCFIPDRVTMPVGGQVIFVVSDGKVHHIVQGTDRSRPYDGEFSVDNLVSGGQFSHVFDTAGEYPYFSKTYSFGEGVIIIE